MGDRSLSESRLTDYLLDLHKSLMLYGLGGATIVGIASLLLVILLLTGVIQWPDWRKLAIGFKIKWNALPKRLNFDLHKVAGITMAIFMSFAAFTGFCWVFEQWTYPAIYALTFSSPSSSENIIVKPQPSQAFAPLSVLLKQAQQTVPGLQVSIVWYPEAKTSPFTIESKTGESVSLDPYTAQVLKVVTPKLKSLSDRVIDSFGNLHFGTFWGLTSQILYVFVGLAPLILFLTGLMIWRYRYKEKNRQQ